MPLLMSGREEGKGEPEKKKEEEKGRVWERASPKAQRWRVRLQYRRHMLDPWVRKIPWRRKWQPTPVFLPGKSHGPKSLVGCKELDMTSDWAHTQWEREKKQKKKIKDSCDCGGMTWWSVSCSVMSTLCDPMDCSLPVSSVHGIFQTRILERVAISFSRGSSWPKDQIWVSHIAGRLFTTWATF